MSKYQDVDSGGNDDREGLAQAITEAKAKRIPIIVSKLCRLSREVYYISKLMKHNIPFIVVEMGQEVPPFMLHIVASLNQEMRRQVGINTSNALQEAKRKGAKLGTHNPKVLAGRYNAGTKTVERLFPHIQLAEKQGLTTRTEISAYLNERGVLTPQGREWTKESITYHLRKIRKIMKEKPQQGSLFP